MKSLAPIPGRTNSGYESGSLEFNPIELNAIQDVEAMTETERYSKFTQSFTCDEMWAIDNLAWMVIRSKQNLGTRMKDHAEIVLKIMASKRHSKQ